MARQATAVGDRREIDAAHAKASEEISKLHRKQVHVSAHALPCTTLQLSLRGTSHVLATALWC